MKNFMYRISVFGNFINIKPAPQDVADLTIKLGSYGFMPTIFTEISEQTQKATQRMMFTSSDNNTRVMIKSERIDVEFVSNEKEWTYNCFNSNNILTKNIFNIIFDKYNIESNRLALFSDNLIFGLNEEQESNMVNKFTNRVGYYKDKELHEWQTRLVTRENMCINSKEEIVNVINIITKVEGQRVDLDIVESFNGYNFKFDINTIPENFDERFYIGSVSEYIDKTCDLHQRIIEEIVRDINA